MLYPLRRLLERLAERDRHALAQTDDGVAAVPPRVLLGRAPVPLDRGSASMSCLTSCFGCALFSDTRLEPRLLFFFGGISSDRPAERARAMSDWVSHHRTIARHGHRASSRLWTNYRRMGVVPGQTIGEKWSKKSVTVVKRGGRRADLWPLLCRNPRMCSDRWLKHGHREDPDRSSGAIPSHSADAMRATCPLGARREKAGAPIRSINTKLVTFYST